MKHTRVRDETHESIQLNKFYTSLNLSSHDNNNGRFSTILAMSLSESLNGF